MALDTFTRLQQAVDVAMSGDVSDLLGVIAEVGNSIEMARQQYRSFEIRDGEVNQFVAQGHHLLVTGLHTYERALQELQQFSHDQTPAHLETGMELADQATKLLAACIDNAKQVEQLAAYLGGPTAVVADPRPQLTTLEMNELAAAHSASLMLDQAPPEVISVGSIIEESSYVNSLACDCGQPLAFETCSQQTMTDLQGNSYDRVSGECANCQAPFELFFEVGSAFQIGDEAV